MEIFVNVAVIVRFTPIVFFTNNRQTFFDLDTVQQQLVISSAVAVGGILAYYVLHKRREVKSIPLGEGWWGTGKKPLSEDDKIYPFTVKTSDDEIKVICLNPFNANANKL